MLEDVLYQVEAGFSEIVLWDDIKDDMPSQLKVSPLAVIPQKDRRGRLILDLSFGVRGSYGPTKGQVIQASVNDTTTRLSPLKPIQELGKVLPRLLDFMATTPDGETVQFSKIDLSEDGFWRMIVNKKDCWNFAYVLPDAPGVVQQDSSSRMHCRWDGRKVQATFVRQRRRAEISCKP